MAPTGRGTHPRPQLIRPHWLDLSGSWQFRADDADRGRSEKWFEGSGEAFNRTIVVPFPPESPASGIGRRGHHPFVWYRRTFHAPAAAEGGRLLLHLGAVDYRADVWLNGHHVGAHEGGHTPIRIDLTGRLEPGDTGQVLVVRAEDRPTDLTQPRGKQEWRPEPHDIWYHRTTGIWQPVWLEPVPDLHIVEVQWTTDLTAATATLQMRLSRTPPSPLTVAVRIRRGDDVLADTTVRTTSDVLRHTVTLPAAHGPDGERLTWSPEHPTLLDVDLTLRDGDRVVDAAQSYLGLRSVGCADGRFLLNHRPYYLRLVLAQGYWPQSHLAAPSADALRREVELVKELGFNGVRVHQKVEDPRFLYWCDRLGLLVWGEMANGYAFDTTAVERLTREWLEVLQRDRSHPCIVTWVPVNESWGVDHVERDPAQAHLVTALYHLTKAVDPTRPVISNDGWEHTCSDIVGVHDYGSAAELTQRYGSPEAIRHTLRHGRPGGRRLLLIDDIHHGQPVVISEFGGLSVAPADGQKWFGYATVATNDELLARFAGLVAALRDSPGIAGYCYTQLTDVEQETNGLLTADRAPKVPPARIRAVLTGG
jgi:beta-galactosidase/beta-glucuronidase